MKPIIMSAEDVRALLDGRKTQTRRLIKPQPKHIQTLRDGRFETSNDGGFDCDAKYIEPLYKPGDVLYVREKWRTVDYEYRGGKWSAAVERVDGTKDIRVSWYDDSDVGIPYEGPYSTTGWKASIHMPREAARLFLRVKDVRVERVQDISEEDAKAEGVTAINNSECGYRGAFRELWNTLNAKRGFDWYTNSWVWVIEFEGCDPE